MKLLQYYFTCFLFLILISCHENESIEKVVEAKKLIKNKPDSALLLLESIDYPKVLPIDIYAEYVLLMICAHKKNLISNKNDTLIFDVYHYYKNKSDLPNITKSALYAGRVYEENNRYDEAKRMYLEAYNTSDISKNYRQKGTSAYEYGELCEEQQEYKKAIVWFEKSEEAFRRAGLTAHESNSIRKTADCYLLSGNAELSLKTYERARQALPANNDDLLSDIYKNMSIAYTQVHNYNQAAGYIRKSIQAASNQKLYPLQYSILSDIYRLKGRMDSSNHFSALALKYSLEQNDLSFLKLAYQAQKEGADVSGSVPESLNHYKLYRSASDSIYQKQKYETAETYQNLFLQEKIKRKEREIVIRTQRYTLLYIALASAFFVLFMFYYWKKKKTIYNKNQIIQDKNSFIKAKDKIIGAYRFSLLKWLDIYKKMVLVSISPNRIKFQKFLEDYNTIVYDSSEEFAFKWEDFNDIMNLVYDNYYYVLRERFPQLNENERQIVLLQKAQFEIPEIAMLMRKSINTIYKRNTDIRKKISVSDAANIIDHIDKVLAGNDEA